VIDSTSPDNPWPEDPVLVSARREALFVAGLFLAAMLYTVSYCAWFGYDLAAEDLRFVWGFPEWVFWGIVIPWGVCLVISTWFAFFFMRDDPLDDGGETTPEAGE
jgi:hypothetical protein